MFWRKRDTEKNRYYLLPGMGGSNYRRKRKLMLQAAVIVGVLVSLAVAAILYFFNNGFR